MFEFALSSLVLLRGKDRSLAISDPVFQKLASMLGTVKVEPERKRET